MLKRDPRKAYCARQGLQVSKAKDVTKKNPIVLSREIDENVFTIYFYSKTAANRVNPRENIMLRVVNQNGEPWHRNGI